MVQQQASMSGHFSVVVRCKPSAEEKSWRCSPTSVEYAGEDEAPFKLDFDRVFTEGSTHAELYEQSVAPHVACALQGANVTVVTYGLPCSGKSHTIFGTSGQSRIKKEARGIITRSGQQIFDALQKEDHSGIVYRITTTFYHVFEDGRVADLFNTKKRNLDVSENLTTMMYTIPNLTEHVVTSPHDVLRLVEKGYLMRNASGCTREQRGAVKSPPTQPLQQYRQHCSHAVFRFTIEQSSQESSTTKEVTISHITIVDLAGKNIESFHTGVPCSDDGVETLHHILTLLPDGGIVAASTSFPKSNLTKLLKPSFGGNCRTTIIANVCLNESSAALTRKCLELLQPARKIKNFSKVVTIPFAQTKLGKCLEETDSLKTEVGSKLQISSPIASWERESDSCIRINGSSYDSLSVSCQDLVKRIAAMEAQLIFAGRPLKQTTSSPAKPLRGPLVMLRPTSRPPGGTLTTSTPPGHPSTSSSPLPKPTIIDKLPTTVREGQSLLVPPSSSPFPPTTKKLLTAQSVPESRKEGGKQRQQVRGKEQPDKERGRQPESNESSSTLEESDSDSEVDPLPSPAFSGPLPPPLKGIPHIKPNPASKDEPPSPAPILVPRPLSGVSKAPTSGEPNLTAGAPATSTPVPTSEEPNLTAGAPATSTPVPTSEEPNLTARAPATSTPVPTLPSTVHVRQAPSPLPRQPPQVPKQPADLPHRTPLMVAKPSPTIEPPLPTTPRPTSASSLSSSTPSPLPLSAPGPASVPQIAPVSTSTPKARRTLLPELPTNTAQNTLRLHPITAAQKGPSIEAPAPKGTHLPQTSSPLANVQPPRVPLSPIRPLLSHHAPAPMWTTVATPAGSRLPEEESEREEDDSSSDVTLSDTDLSSEARDDFDPTIRRRQLPLQPIRPYPYPTAATMGHICILPPIGQGPSHPSLPLTNMSILPPINNLPTYEQASFDQESKVPPDYYEETGRVRRKEKDQEVTEEETIDMSGYMSSEEIHMAAMEGVKAATMRKLAIQFGVDYRDHGGRTPLMYAVLGNQPKVCEVLLGLGAAVNTRDASGLTPLLWATYHAKSQVIRVLLRHGADVELCDSEGRTSFHWAMKTPNIQCLKVLCKHANSIIVNKTDQEGLSPLHWAVMSDQAAHVRVLLTSTPANVRIQDNEGRTPLNYAVLNFSPSCIKAILDCCENAVNLADSKGRTALHYACAEGSADCVRTLLAYHSCNLHCTDLKGTTPLHWAAAANQPGLVQLLLRRGADRGQRDCDDMTPLDHAQQRRHTDCIKILQTYGLKRPPSALSVASQVSLTPTTDPLVDKHGHVPLRRPKRQFSLSGISVSSINRLPADGQANSETPPEEQSLASGGGQQDVPSTGEGAAQEHSSLTSRSRISYQQPRSRQMRWLLLCGSSGGITCCSGRSNVVVPTDSASS